MNKKYEFTGETMDCFGYTLRRIKAIENFGDVKKGDIGGWIETEKNLYPSAFPFYFLFDYVFAALFYSLVPPHFFMPPAPL